MVKSLCKFEKTVQKYFWDVRCRFLWISLSLIRYILRSSSCLFSNNVKLQPINWLQLATMIVFILEIVGVYGICNYNSIPSLWWKPGTPSAQCFRKFYSGPMLSFASLCQEEADFTTQLQDSSTGKVLWIQTCIYRPGLITEFFNELRCENNIYQLCQADLYDLRYVHKTVDLRWVHAPMRSSIVMNMTLQVPIKKCHIFL